MLTIGLTGGIGSGKTTVSNLFAKLGVVIADADIAAREVVEPGTDALATIKGRFGNEVIASDGSLNRKALREVVFDNPAQRKWLERLLHPLIRQQLTSQLEQADSPYAILASPLLLETDQHTLVDRILIVDLPESLQLDRAAARDNANIQQIKAIMAAQMSRSERCKRADDIILNDSGISELKAKVLSLHQHYLTLAEEASTKHD